MIRIAFLLVLYVLSLINSNENMTISTIGEITLFDYEMIRLVGTDKQVYSYKLKQI